MPCFPKAVGSIWGVVIPSTRIATDPVLEPRTEKEHSLMGKLVTFECDFINKLSSIKFLGLNNGTLYKILYELCKVTRSFLKLFCKCESI